MIQNTSPKDALEVQRALQEILKRDAEAENSLIDRFLAWLEELFSFEGPGGATSQGWFLVQKAIMILAAAAIIFLVVRMVILKLVTLYTAAGQDEEEQLPVIERVARLRLEAQQARQAGDWQLALQKQFFALVLGLGERGDLEFRDAWTNRELLALGSPSVEVQRVLRPLLEELEPKEFGRKVVEARDLDRLENLALDYFGALPEERR